VLLISGIVNNTVLERAAKVRSDDVMRKPFAADELLHRIESFLSASGRPAPAPAAGAPAPAVAATVTPAVVEPAPIVPPAPVPVRPVARPERPAPVPEPVAAAAAPPAAPAAPELKALLAGVAELAGVSLIALIDREGAVMEVAGGLLPEAEFTGALAACLVESTDGVGRALTQGRLQSLILEYDAGVVLLNAVGADAMLAVVLGDPAVLGKVRYHVKKALPDLVRAV
jgi:predicted regulator of Ras-like GTPase activity (Roadblock/LC7/MglB family)